MTELGREQSGLPRAHFRHEFVHREIRTERIRAGVRNSETLKNLLYFPVLAVFAVQPDENGIELAQNAFRRSRASLIVSHAFSIDIDIARAETLVG